MSTGSRGYYRTPFRGGYDDRINYELKNSVIKAYKQELHLKVLYFFAFKYIDIYFRI